MYPARDSCEVASDCYAKCLNVGATQGESDASEAFDRRRAATGPSETVVTMMRVSRLVTLTLLAATFVLSACHSTVRPGPELAASDITTRYRLGPGDHIKLMVFNQPSLSSDFTVDGAGFLSLPLLGPLKAEDQTTRQLEQSIAQELIDRKYLVNPSVAVQIVEFRPYYILGEINSPGSYPYIVNLTITKAVAAAKGYTYRANTHRVYIQRSGENTEVLYGVTPGTAVLPGDTIRVPERRF
jgi:protein involved in polysaccharide export with SLBB domain